MLSVKKIKIQRPGKKSSNKSNVVIVKHMTIPVKETEELRRINKMLANAKFMD